jgi:hypothetical protein
MLALPELYLGVLGVLNHDALPLSVKLHVVTAIFLIATADKLSGTGNVARVFRIKAFPTSTRFIEKTSVS